MFSLAVKLKCKAVKLYENRWSCCEDLFGDYRIRMLPRSPSFKESKRPRLARLGDDACETLKKYSCFLNVTGRFSIRSQHNSFLNHACASRIRCVVQLSVPVVFLELVFSTCLISYGPFHLTFLLEEVR